MHDTAVRHDPLTPEARSGHVDTFCADRLPPRELWPVRDWSGVPELAYPARLNCAAELLGGAIRAGHGPRPALRWPGGEWSYDELREKVDRIANVLVRDLGLVPGNRVLLRATNTPMLAAAWLAVVKAGGVVVCTMPLLREREIQYVADRAEIRLALTDARVADDCEAAFRARRDGTPREGARVVRFGTDAPDGLEAMMERAPATFDACDTAATDIALIAFTSGTTGQGKGTMHEHRDVMAITDCFPRYVLRPRADDVFCGSPPLGFTYALGGLLLFPMRVGACALLLEQATPPHLARAIAEHRPTICFTAPTAYRAMCGMVAEHDVSSLRECVSAGETLPASVFEAWRAATGLRIIDGIGSTEMLHIFISASGDDIRPGATGKVVPGYQATVLDDDGREAPPGVVGRLAVRGPTGCRYLDAPERQREYVQDGWNLTGDSYLRDADGYFWYQARTDDIIISAGYNIAGPEVENVLLEHAAVQECAVVGAPDEERGQIVKAFVVVRPGTVTDAPLAKELQEWVKARIAPYKYPRAVEFVAALPRTTTGKVQRFRLREAAS
ncbi:MAG TPA: AMP-binding protein [Gemmatimonadaceae bacterium]|nr:AMP-binding protein [Gemmatimonadaceae bacterium]